MIMDIKNAYQPSLKDAYAEASRLFPHWPEKDLWAEARYILKHGFMRQPTVRAG